MQYLEQVWDVDAAYKTPVICSIHISEIKSLQTGIAEWDLPPYRNIFSSVESPFLLVTYI